MGAQRNADTLTWTIGDVAPAELARVTYTAEVLSPLANGTRISNQASIDAQGFVEPFLTDDPSTPTADDPTVLVVTSAPILTVRKVATPVDGSVFRAGRRVRYDCG